MRRLATTAAMLAVGLVLASPSPAAAQADANGPVTVGECVGSHVSSVVQGDYMRHIPDRVIGDTPAILESPGGQTVGTPDRGDLVHRRELAARICAPPHHALQQAVRARTNGWLGAGD